MTDDSEEIFRRAADNYPLRNDNPDWEAVLSKLEKSEDEKAVVEILSKTKNRRYRWFFLLLLLIPLAIIEKKYTIFTGIMSKNKQTAPAASGSTTAHLKESGNMEDIPGSTAGKQDQEINDQSSQSNNESKETTHARVEEAVANPNNIATGKPVVHSFNEAYTASHEAPAKKFPKNNDPGKPANGNQLKTSQNHDEEQNAKHSKISLTSNEKKKIKVINGETAEDDAVGQNMIDKKSEQATIPAGSEINIPKADTSDAIAKKTDIEKLKASDTLKTADKKNDKKKEKQKNFYIGFVIGPDLSTIKFQSIDKVGISFGFITGYRITKNLSIETGFLFDQKLYSSKGEYFSTKNIPVYPNSTIEYVTGTCNMYEIPLNLYYSFGKKERSSWFGSTGISSYLMNKEEYTFDINYNNTIYPYTRDYESHYNKFAAVINISAGYVRKIGKAGDLRIEPYIKLPIGKVGTGELPIQSAGILFGFTRSIF